jgi:hypothetical protein
MHASVQTLRETRHDLFVASGACLVADKFGFAEPLRIVELVFERNRLRGNHPDRDQDSRRNDW